MCVWWRELCSRGSIIAFPYMVSSIVIVITRTYPEGALEVCECPIMNRAGLSKPYIPYLHAVSRAGTVLVGASQHSLQLPPQLKQPFVTGLSLQCRDSVLRVFWRVAWSEVWNTHLRSSAK